MLQLAWPLVLSFTLRATFTLVDRFYAGTLEGLEDASQAAIGLAQPIEFLMIACWVGASNGLTSKLSAAMGAKQSEKVDQLSRAGMLVSTALAVAFLLFAALLWFAPTIVAPSAAPDVVRQFQIYASVVVGGSALTTFWSILPDSVVKAHHDTVTTMWAGILSSLLNVALNTLFVFVFEWGIFGIAFSTVIGRLAGLVYAWLRAAAHERRRRAEIGAGEPGRFDNALKEILGIAIPSGLTYVLMAVEGAIINEILRRGDDPTVDLAAWSVYDGLGRSVLMPAIAFGVAMLPLISRRRAEGRGHELRRELRIAISVVVGYALLLVAPFCLFAHHWLAEQFVKDPAALDRAATGILWLPLVVVFAGSTLVARPAFDALDRAKLGLLVSVARSLVLAVPLTYLGGLVAAWLGYVRIEGYYAGSVVGTVVSCALVFGVVLRLGPFRRGGGRAS
ncbi:MAG: MATE family efflux transporter [Planctomycetota bacterium]